MPSSLFKSRPKGDRRKEWKALKTKHAAALTAAKIKVEIGLGEALDNHQKQVERIVLVTPQALNAAAFAPVVASAAAVAKLVGKLEPKVKKFDDITAFLQLLKQDSVWWQKAPLGVATMPTDELSQWNVEQVTTVVNNMRGIGAHMDVLDGMLKGADQPTATYKPPVEFGRWLKLSQTIRPYLAKLAVLGKNPTGNFQQVADLMEGLKPTLLNFRSASGHLESLIRRSGPTPAANWQTVAKEAKAMDEKLLGVTIALQKFRDYN